MVHKYPQNQSYVGSSGQTITTNVSMTLCNWRICHQTHVLWLHYIWYQIKLGPKLIRSLRLLWGNVCPARARRATFVLTIPTSAPDLPSHGEAPQVDHIALHTFPTKHVAK